MRKHNKRKTDMRIETVGVDLGDKLSRYCILDPDGEIVEEGSFRNLTSSIEKHFVGERRRIALEAGAQSVWISRELKRLGHEVIVANARELKWITANPLLTSAVSPMCRALPRSKDEEREIHRRADHRCAETARSRAESAGAGARDGRKRSDDLHL